MANKCRYNINTAGERKDIFILGWAGNFSEETTLLNRYWNNEKLPHVGRWYRGGASVLGP